MTYAAPIAHAESMASTRLLLIRHGQSDSQVTGVVTDHDSCKGRCNDAAHLM